jgi:hypothetical protein
MEFDIRGLGRTSQRTQSRNGEIGLDGQAENDVRESHFLGQQSDHLGSRSAKASLPVLPSRFTFRACTRITSSVIKSHQVRAPFTGIYLLDVSPRCKSASAIEAALGSLALGEFPHRPVNGQCRLRIRLFRLPFYGLNHSQPPHEYIEPFAPNATKC